MDGVLKDLNIKPGFQKNNTIYSSEAEWIDGDKVRFKFGYPEKIGGWIKHKTTSVGPGVPRAIHTWADLGGEKLIAIGTNLKLILYRFGSDYQDITPSGFVGGPESNLAAFGYGSGPYSGDYPPLASLTSGVDYTSASEANEFFTSGITSADLGYSESPTSISAGSGLSTVKLVQWSLDNYGEDLIANPRGGAIYRWDRSQETEPASAIPGAPTRVNTVVISEPAPYLVAFGTCVQEGNFDPLLVRWSDLENFSDWNASSESTAGDFRIQGGSEIVNVHKTKRETLIFTDDVVFSMQQTGGDGVFEFERLGANCGAISQHCAIDVNAIVYWMGNSAFFKYDGRIQPLETPLDEAVFDRSRSTSLNFFQREKVYTGINSEFNEIIWLYPSRDSEECDRYVIYNYLENIWYDGSIVRTTWTDGDIFEQPIATHSNGTLFDHEVGKNDDTSVMVSWIKTGIFDIDDGDKLLFVDKFVPDMTIVGEVDLNVVGKKYPHAASVMKGPYMISQSTPKVNFRMRARQMQFSISCSMFNGDYELGTNRVNIRPDGER